MTGGDVSVPQDVAVDPCRDQPLACGRLPFAWWVVFAPRGAEIRALDCPWPRPSDRVVHRPERAGGTVTRTTAPAATTNDDARSSAGSTPKLWATTPPA